jgi:hypothetical protein
LRLFLLITIPIMGGKFRAYSPVQFLGSTSDNAD